nr:hypothetical protein [Acaryochloris sp. CCMEE 5410]
MRWWPLHRSGPGKARLKEVDRTKSILGIPEDYVCGMSPPPIRVR